MASTRTHIHARSDDEITITSGRNNGYQWVTVEVGSVEFTIFPAGDDAIALLDHMACEIAAARESLAVSKRPTIAEPAPVQAGA